MSRISNYGIAGSSASAPVDLADNLSTNPNTSGSVNNLTATSGGGQASAYGLGLGFYRFTTVAAANDSAGLPPAVAGRNITVCNASANSMNVFPALGEVINGLAANAAFAVPAGKICVFYPSQGVWNTLLSA